MLQQAKAAYKAALLIRWHGCRIRQGSVYRGAPTVRLATAFSPVCEIRQAFERVRDALQCRGQETLPGTDTLVCRHLVDRPNLKPVHADKDTESRLLLLAEGHTNGTSCWPCRSAVFASSSAQDCQCAGLQSLPASLSASLGPDLECIPYELTLTYDNFTANQVLKVGGSQTLYNCCLRAGPHDHACMPHAENHP